MAIIRGNSAVDSFFFLSFHPSFRVCVCVCVCVCVRARAGLVAQSCLTATFWTVSHQALLSMGFSRQEYWSGLPCPPPPGYLPDPGLQPALLWRILYPLIHRGSPSFLSCPFFIPFFLFEWSALILTSILCLFFLAEKHVRGRDY